MASQEMPELCPLANGPWSVLGAAYHTAQCPDIRALGGGVVINELRWCVSTVGVYV